jgi:hypothetical protein
MEYEGQLAKLASKIDDSNKVQYSLPLSDKLVHLNPLIGKNVLLEYLGAIHCTHCERKIKKSFNGGYCFPCVRSLACCDICIVKPELCHYEKGTCREPSWGESNCMIDHTIYLANSSGLKVGITRSHQRMTRWIDQGASAAIPIATVKKRLDAGLIEVQLSQVLADKTNWRKMLSGPAEPIDLLKARADALSELKASDIWEPATDDVTNIEYPVVQYPQKIKSLNLEKTAVIEGKLLGIKGQYLIFDTGVLNVRKYSGYSLKLALP